MSGKTMHMTLSVRGALRWRERQLRNATKWILKPDGTRHTPDSLRDALMDALAAGYEVLPLQEPCEGFDPKKGCLGHATGGAHDGE